MKKLLLAAAILLALTSLIFLHCTKNIAGGTEVGNPSVSAMLYEPDGITPAVGAKVRFFRFGVDPRTSLSVAVDSTTTNANGNYTATLDTGTYNILASKSGNATFQDSIRTIKDSTLHPPADTIEAPGSISGRVVLEEGGDARLVFILFLGTNTFTMPDDSIGNFITPQMAKGRYRVRVLTTLDNYAPTDTTLNVTAGTIDTLPGPITLKYTGIPTPQNVRISYDTLKQIVMLTWNKPTTGRAVKGYNIYRMNVDSNTALATISPHLVTDTVYSDSTGIQDLTYEYRVAAVDTNGTEGVKSAAVSVKIIGFLAIVDSIVNGNGSNDGQFGYLVHATMDSIRDFYVIDTKNKLLQKLDSAGRFIFKFASLNYPCGITLDIVNKVLYISDALQSLIIKLTTNGDTLTSWQPAKAPGGIIYHDGKLYITLPDTGIQVCDSIGHEIAFYKYQFKIHNSDNINLCLDLNGNIYVSDAENILELDTLSRTLKPIYTLTNFDQNQDPDIVFTDANTILLETRGAAHPYQSSFYLIDKNTGTLKSNGHSIEAITDMIFSTNQHRLFAFTGSGKILSYQINF